MNVLKDINKQLKEFAKANNIKVFKTKKVKGLPTIHIEDKKAKEI